MRYAIYGDDPAKGGTLVKWPEAEKTRRQKPKEDYPDITDEKSLNESAFREWKEWTFVDFLDQYAGMHGANAIVPWIAGNNNALVEEFKRPPKESWDGFMERLIAFPDSKALK